MVKDCLILAGAGVGGGSLVYANTLYEPLERSTATRPGRTSPTGRPSSRPTTTRPSGCSASWRTRATPADEVMKKVAEEMGVGHTFHPTPGRASSSASPARRRARQVADPFFGGAGPDAQRLPQLRRVHDRLPAQRQEHPGQELPPPRRAGNGAVVHPLTTVTRVRPRDEGGYEVTARWTKAKLSRRTAIRTFTADQVVFSAAALGTQKLLHQLKAEGHLPRITDRLGRAHPHQLRGDPRRHRRRRRRRLHARASRSPRASTPTSTPTSSRCATARGSNAMALMQTVLADDVPGESRVAHLAARSCGAQRARPARPLRPQALVASAP